jgi:hypothetical protein
MKKMWMVVAAGSLFAAAGMAETWTGTVSDSMCGAKHEGAAAADAACVKKCVKGGASAVLVSGGKVYQLSADSQKKVETLLGQKVNVNGKLEGETIEVEAAQPVKN